jgi:transposase
MEAYSEDLRKRIVDAIERRRMGQSEAARTFDVSLSSVKRYLRKFRQGRSLSPGKAPSRRPRSTNGPGSCSKRTSKNIRLSPSRRGATTYGL